MGYIAEYAQNSEEQEEMSKFLTQRLPRKLAEPSGIALIETLVVVGIIVALIAIFIPVFS